MAAKKGAKKLTLQGFSAGAWAGACFGLASTILVMEFSLRAFPQPLVVGLLSALLDTILLVGGVIGYTFFRQFSPKKRK